MCMLGNREMIFPSSQVLGLQARRVLRVSHNSHITEVALCTVPGTTPPGRPYYSVLVKNMRKDLSLVSSHFRGPHNICKPPAPLHLCFSRYC